MTIFACPIYDEDLVGSTAQPTLDSRKERGIDNNVFVINSTYRKPVIMTYFAIRDYPKSEFAKLPASFYSLNAKSSDFSRDIASTCSFAALDISQIAALDIFAPTITTEQRNVPSPKVSATKPLLKVEEKQAPARVGPPVDTIKLPKADELKIKMHINKQVGQICDSWSQVRKVALNLREFISAKSDINERWFAYDMLVQKIISQAETQCALQKRSSFSLAATTIILFNYFPEFMQYFMEKLKEKCPFIEKGSDCSLNSSDSRYLETVTGIVHLYAALIAYSYGHFSSYEKKVDISEGWKFVANFLNSTPKIFTSMVLCAFLDIASHSLWLKYGVHFQKLLNLIKHELYPKLPKASTASNESLLLYIESILGGSISTPDGYKIAE